MNATEISARQGFSVYICQKSHSKNNDISKIMSSQRNLTSEYFIIERARWYSGLQARNQETLSSSPA